jgi:hypothetical protein
MDTLYRNAFCLTKACRDREDAKVQLEAERLQLLSDIANQPASGNSLIILLPIAIVLIGGIIAIAVIKSKKGK